MADLILNNLFGFIISLPLQHSCKSYTASRCEVVNLKLLLECFICVAGILQ